MLQKLGFGLGLRPVHYPDFHARTGPAIDWLEIISENFLGIGGRARQHLAKIRADYPIASHGVGLDIAGRDPLNWTYLRALKEHIDWLQPSLVTDHLCWTSWRGQPSYDLLPFPLNEESLQHVISRLHTVQEFLGCRMLIENPSCYIDFKASDIPEPEFLNEICARTGAGILLDLNNCIVNSKNLAWDPWRYIKTLDAKHIGQFHLAGHSVSPEICIDTHGQAVPDEVWELYRGALTLFPDVPTLIEWDDQVPSLSRLGEELARARIEAESTAKVLKDPAPSPIIQSEIDKSAPHRSLAAYQEALFTVLMAQNSGEELAANLKDTLAETKYGLKAYTNNYYMRYLETLKESFPSLLAIIEDEAMHELAMAFARHCPAEHFSVNFIGQKLANFIEEYPLAIDFGVPKAMIAELAAFDWVRLELYLQSDDSQIPLKLENLLEWSDGQWTEACFTLRKDFRLLDLRWDILSVYRELEASRYPPPPALAEGPLLFHRTESGIHIEACPGSLLPALRLKSASFSLAELIKVYQDHHNTEEAAAAAAVQALVLLTERQVLSLFSLGRNESQ
ncbi:MAG: DUF692 family protein [Proteobacteria bacterium]|nr:DUF692 family protein [Pseudomonadota bacterium]